MISFINYLIEINLGLVFFYGMYWLLLKNENQFETKRVYLVGSLLASILFPLFTFESNNLLLIPTLSESVPTHWLPEIIVYGNGTVASEKASTQGYWTWISYAYFAIAIIILVVLVVRLLSIARLYLKAQRYSWKSYKVAESADVKGVFSFFRFIFLSPAENLEAQEKEEILRHEEVHIQKVHSFDILLINAIGIVCWFNPVIRSYKKSLVQVHEFEADARSVEGMDVDRYCGLLAKVALQTNGYVLANHFTNSFTLKRINMMKTVRRKISQWKMASVFLMLAMYFVVVACQDQVLSDIKEMGQNSSIALDYPAEVESKLAELKSKHPKDEFIVIEMNEEGKKKLEALDADKSITSNIKEMNVIKSADQSSYIILVKGDKADALADFTKDGEIFTIVDQTAEPKGGMEEFYKHIAANMSYPALARQKGIEGRVFIEFVINEDGSITDAKPLKGIGAGCDEEATRVVAIAPAWLPAKQAGKIVKQRMVIPIIFKLGNSNSKVDVGQTEQKTMDEIVVVGQPKKN